MGGIITNYFSWRWIMFVNVPIGVLSFSPLQAGFAFLPTAMGVIAGAGLTSRLIGRFGPRVPMTAGALLVSSGGSRC
jgi:hypothetical protein